MKKENEMVSSMEVDEFSASFVPWGYLDIRAAIETYKTAGKTSDDLREAIEEFQESVECSLDEIDPVYVAFNTLQQEARTEIEEATEKDISNDDPFSSVNVYGNYMATSFDWKDDANEEIKKLIDTMKEKSKVVQWYYNQL